MNRFRFKNQIIVLLVSAIFCYAKPGLAQNTRPNTWDIDQCYYEKDSARYILIRHQISNYPTLWERNENVMENYRYMSIWDLTTGKLVTSYRLWVDRWYVNGNEIYPYHNESWNDQQNYRYDPPFPNGTYFKMINNGIEVYDDATNSLKYVIHPQEAYRKKDYSEKRPMIQQSTDALIETEKQKGFSLLMRIDTTLPEARMQQFHLNRKNGKVLVDKTDCDLFVVTAADSLLVLKTEVIPNGRFFSYTDSSKKFDENILTYNLSFAGSTKDINISFEHLWSNVETPASVLLFGKANGEMSTGLSEASQKSIVAAKDSIKASAAVRTLVKSKMLPGDKMVLDTNYLIDPKLNNNQTIINAEFDKTYNRTLYVAVKTTDDSLYILGHYNSERLVYMPAASIKKISTSGYTIYRCSFTGDISYFDIVHTVQSTTNVYYFLTKRPDEKGLAANKKYFDEWDGDIAKDKEETVKEGERNRQLASSLAEIQSNINKRCTVLRQSAIDNHNILSKSSLSASIIQSSVKDVLGKYEKLSDYVMTNESKIRELGSNRSAYSAYFDAVFKSLLEMEDARNTIMNTIDAASNKDKLDIHRINAAIFDIQQAARDILWKSNN